MLDFASIALVLFLLASAAGALGMTRAAVFGFALTFGASFINFALDPNGPNSGFLSADIDPSTITFTSSAEATMGIALDPCTDSSDCVLAAN